MKKLPIDAIVPQVKQALGNCNALIIKATPGSGKTTRVPPALLDVIPAKSRLIVLEPRRLAARLAAERVASELGVPCGDLVGYHIRFEQKLSASTRILFMTEGMLMRYLIADPELKDTAAVILDEFHERHLHTDVALAAVRRLQSTVRKDLKLVVMSATLDVAALSKALDGPESVETSVEAYPLTVLHEASATQSESVEISLQRTTERIAPALVRAIEHHVAQGIPPSHALVFLPGAADIDRAAAALESFIGRTSTIDPLNGAILLKLHGSMPPAEQKRVFDPSPVMKIILATNIAESSLTVDGVNIVIDAGLGKFPSQSLWAGLPVLKLQRVSQASCTQRAGRAARQGPGVVARLFSEADFRGRSGFELPEIMRLDLTQTLLEVACVVDRPGQGPALEVVNKLTWVDPPEGRRVAAGVSLLAALGAVDAEGHVTQVGHAMARYPLHPRLSRIIEEGKRRDLVAAAVTFAAQVSEQAQGGRPGSHGFATMFKQIARLAGASDLRPVEIPSSGPSLRNFTPVILAGYGDRVARREGEQNNHCSYRLVDGRTFIIKQSGSALPEWLCLVDADVSPSDVSRIMPREWVALAMTPDFSALRAVEGLWKEGLEVFVGNSSTLAQVPLHTAPSLITHHSR